MVLKQVQEKVAGHKGSVWTHVISPRSEDAARLGYDSAARWMSLLRSKRAMLCRRMKIDSANMRWYAASHNEGIIATYTWWSVLVVTRLSAQSQGNGSPHGGRWKGPLMT